MTRIIKIFLLAAALLAGVSSCGEKELPASTRGAIEQGRADAKALCAAQYTAERDLHAALLAVKAREWQLRQKGDSVAATAYIDAFKEQLTQSDKTLASKVF